MKVFHRIRRYLIPLLLFILHCATALSPPPTPDFTKCNEDLNGGNLRCIVHKSCISKTTEGYVQPDDETINAGCTRYLLVRAKTLHEAEIEFRDDTFDKTTGAEIRSARGLAFTCVKNVASSPTDLNAYIKEGNYGKGFNGLYCKFKVAHTTNNVIKRLQQDMPKRIDGKVSGSEVKLTIGPVASFEDLFIACDWGEVTRTSNQDSSIESFEEQANLVSETSKMTCPLFNWFKSQSGGNKWERIGDSFTCSKGKVEFQHNQAWTTFEENLGVTKCIRPRCSICTCPDGVCSANSTADPTKPEFKATDGETCTQIACSTKHMLVDTGSGLDAHPGNSLECSTESKPLEAKWKGGIDTSKIKGVSCVEIISCNQLHPMRSDCTEAKNVDKDMICTNATLKDDGTAVCGGADEETWFQPTGGSAPHKYGKFKCNSTSGRWLGEPPARVDIVKNSNVYCLSKAPPPDIKPKTGSAMNGGTIIGIILGVAVVAAVIAVIVVLCLRRRIKKKGNRDEMKSVSVTGRLDKNSKKKKKKGKSSSSKTSEVSAPPPPPCPDSLNLPNEPEPVPPPSGPPSSGPAPVGPDTGKPDKPAELIDIKLESEKKNDVSSKKEDKEKAKDADTTVVNTVTGTGSFGDKPTAAAGKDNKDPTDTKKDKNGESARSDTGKTGTKDTTKKIKNKKIQLDKNGKGMTDDDDYKIDDNGKPVNHEDKNKKPYKPPIDPRKKMINVTVTEDDEGHMRPKAKQSLF